MPASNTKRIEEAATTALKSALLRCPILESYIDTNDKTPSWDGTVFIYKDQALKKINLLGRAPIQVKGTEKWIVSDTASYPCQISDLKNYYRDGGCVFFLVSVDLSEESANVYYSSLQVFDLKKILDDAQQQQSVTIRLKKFPQDDANEMASIFMSFVENSRKQTSFIDKEIPSLEQLKDKGVEIESILFNTSGIGLNRNNIESFISTHEFYLYAKPKGLDIEIPFDKVSDPIVSKTIHGKVQVKDKEFFSSYSVIHENGKASIHIGKGISLLLNPSEDHPEENKITVNVNPQGTLSDFIQDTACFLAMLENQQVTINGVLLQFKEREDEKIDKFRCNLRYYKDIKRMLEILGVTEELQCDNLSKEDEVNIRNFVNGILYNKKINFNGAKEPMMHGVYRIANLSIWIWATRTDDGLYQVESFFDPHPIVIFDSNDSSHSNPVPASQYLLLDKEAFIHTSNMDYEVMKKDICAMEHRPLVNDYTILLMLLILCSYDEQIEKECRLLDLAETICLWLAKDDTVDASVLRLNQLQIEKRRRDLTTQEIVELSRYAGDDNPVNIRCGAYLLLGDSNEAQKCFDMLPNDEQKEFLKFPICHFGKLIQKENQQ